MEEHTHKVHLYRDSWIEKFCKFEMAQWILEECHLLPLSAQLLNARAN